MKLHEKPGKSTEVKINIGIMGKERMSLLSKRGVILSVTVKESSIKESTSLTKQCQVNLIEMLIF